MGHNFRTEGVRTQHFVDGSLNSTVNFQSSDILKQKVKGQGHKVSLSLSICMCPRGLQMTNEMTHRLSCPQQV